jgi:hypothetical protein
MGMMIEPDANGDAQAVACTRRKATITLRIA